MCFCRDFLCKVNIQTLEKNCMDPGSSERPVRPQAGWMPRGDVSHRTAAGIEPVRMVCDGSVSNESRLGSITNHGLAPFSIALDLLCSLLNTRRRPQIDASSADLLCSLFQCICLVFQSRSALVRPCLYWRDPICTYDFYLKYVCMF